MTIEIYIALLLFVILMVGTPGPANLILMAAGAKWGVRRCLPFIAGVTCGKLFLNIVLAAGLLALLDSHPLVRDTMRWLSCAYLLWLAWRIAALRLSAARTDDDDNSPGFLAGLIVHPLNPKAWAMITAAYAQFSSVSAGWLEQTAIFALTFFVVQCAVHPAWCWGGHLLVKLLGNTVWEKRIMRLLALITALLVIYLTVREL